MRIHERTAVESIEISSGRAVGVRAEGKLWPSTFVVAAAGAWSPLIPGTQSSGQIPVRPVKGQMVCLTMNVAHPTARHVMWSPKSYVVPRNDGRLLIGATTEERGFDTSVTAGGLLALLEGAWRLLPSIEELPVQDIWAGSRPGSRDNVPILGRCNVDGLLIATGHYRNGVLLAPATAAAIADLVVYDRVSPLIKDMNIDRFSLAPRP